MDHYNQPVRRNAEFFKPPNALKAKVGSGGLSEDILDRAQDAMDNTLVDFLPAAEEYLNKLQGGVEMTRTMHPATHEDKEAAIGLMLYPAMQLKGNGGMFRYPLVTTISQQLIQFLEVIEGPDDAALEIVQAFYTTIRAVVLGRITGDGGPHGLELQRALHEACMRYFEKKPVRPLT